MGPNNGTQYQYQWIKYYCDHSNLRKCRANLDSGGCKNAIDLRESLAWPQVQHNELILSALDLSTTRNLLLFVHTIPQIHLIQVRPQHYQKSAMFLSEHIVCKILRPAEECSERSLFSYDKTELCDASFDV